MKNAVYFIIIFAVSALIISACTAPVVGNPPAETVSTPAPTWTSESHSIEPTPTEETLPSVTPEPPVNWVAYIGDDGNLWLVDRTSGEKMQITQDAVLMQPNAGAEPIRYCCMQWSSDGNLLSYLREESIQVENAYNYDYTFLVYEIQTGNSRPLMSGQSLLGYAWKPGTHLIAYGLPVEQDYWISRDAVRAEVAHGIMGLNVDSGETVELVAPERGFTLGLPRWSPDGRFLSFDEIQFMEGRGLIGFYDFQNGQYVSREDTLGSYSWSADGEQLAYDKIDYRPLGGERIWLSAREGGQETALSPEYDSPGYAFAPAFSPSGSQVAFLANFENLDENFMFNLFVVDATGGEPRAHGSFEQVWQLHWTSDENFLVFSAGAFEQKLVIEVNLTENSFRQLAQGSEAVAQP